MKTIQLDYLNFLELADIPNFVQSADLRKNSFPEIQMRKHHPRLGIFDFKSIQLPHIHAMDLSWNVMEDIVVNNTPLSNTININFQLRGESLIQFGQQMKIEMKGNRHNLLFNPESLGSHTLRRNEELKMLHISFDKRFFIELIGYDDHWSEAAFRKIEKGEPFMALHNSPNITPVMGQLIQSIQQNSWEGSIRNLQVQSRLFELLALQIEQFKHPVIDPYKLKKKEVEQLYYLHQYLQVNFLEDMTLTSLCKLIAINEFKLKKGFKLLFGKTVFGLVKELRMQYAAILLKDQKLSVEEVAHILGYAHPQHFSTSFRKQFGFSPVELKK